MVGSTACSSGPGWEYRLGVPAVLGELVVQVGSTESTGSTGWEYWEYRLGVLGVQA